jgi:hypothetical protein
MKFLVQALYGGKFDAVEFKSADALIVATRKKTPLKSYAIGPMFGTSLSFSQL